MKTILNYTHGRNLFKGSEFKPFVHRYFKDVEFLGFESGYWGPSISVSNWDEVCHILPKSYHPESVQPCK